METKPTLAVLGGTGDLGAGLALRWIEAGYKVIIGSRERDKASAACVALRRTLAERGIDSGGLSDMDNAAAAAAADIVALTVPFNHQQSTLLSVRRELKGKILIDVTVPLAQSRVGTVQLPVSTSAGQAAQALLGNEVRVVSAFQNVAADHLKSGAAVDCDVLVCGNVPEARAAVVTLVEACGMRGFQAGPIGNAVVAEALTSVLITINRQFNCNTGVRISGL